MSNLAFGFFEFDGASATDQLSIRLHILSATAPPTYNDSNWFKTLRVINNTDSVEFSVARSGFGAPSTANDGTNCTSLITINNSSTWSEDFFVTSDSITVQLRSD